MSFNDWWRLTSKHYQILPDDTEPDYKVIVRDGRPYLYDPGQGWRNSSLDFTTYMYTYKDDLSIRSALTSEPVSQGTGEH